MPRRSRARRPSGLARFHLDVMALAEAMEQPLRRARGLADALTFVGYGLESVNDDGARPVLTLATDLADDLDVVTARWNGMYAASALVEKVR